MLEFGATVRAYPGEACSGDAAVIHNDADAVLFGVVDALGHGTAAAAAANRATELLSGTSLREPIATIVRELDLGLRGGRGAAAMLCLVRGDELEGCGVGNVELRTIGMRIGVVTTPGVLGRGPAVRPRTFAARLVPGVRMVVFSDGVSGRLRADHRRALAAQAASAALLEEWGRETDDAAVLVADVTP
ncbi:MAG: SpoIIE family protein phosphatase [Deltaproteobacteria bacterium]|nr:SpoIIE family protein phosphatase [Deltaproteobacteria bacterium]